MQSPSIGPQQRLGAGRGGCFAQVLLYQDLGGSLEELDREVDGVEGTGEASESG
jgi:hypothetical protein